MMQEKQRTAIISEFKNTLREAIRQNSDFEGIREVKTVIDFYDKIKDREVEPAKVLSIINEHLVNNLSDGFIKEFSSALEKNLDGITLSFDKNGGSFRYSLPDISVSLDFDLVINETSVTIATITIGTSLETEFTISGSKSDTGIKINKIEIDASLFLFTEMILGKKKETNRISQIRHREYRN